MAEADIEALLENRPPSLGRMFFDRVAATPDREAYSFPVGDEWTSVTWAEAGERVTRVAAGLIALGIQPEERVAIASTTRYEWIIADLGILAAGAATTTVYPTTIADDVSYILGDSESRVVFAEDDNQVAKIRSRQAELPALMKIVVIDGEPDDDEVMTLEDLEQVGAKFLAEFPDAVELRVAAARPEDLATLIYTSGTTGRAKGVRLPHSAWTYEGKAVEALRLLSMDDVQLLWLPLAHSFGKVLVAAQLAIGFPTAVDGRADKIMENLGAVRPTFMGAAPRVFEKAHARIVTVGTCEGAVKRCMFERAFAVGREVARRRLAGRPVPRRLALQHAVFDRLVFAKIRDRFGGRLRFFISGAAGLNREIAEWFYAAEVLILEGYGLTETSAGSCVNHPDNFKLGTVGLPLPGTAVKADADGELLVKGPGVMAGYHHLEGLAEEVLRDGWFHTGDVGEIDADGFVRITDRKKDVFKTSGGKYVAPQVIEGRFKAVCPYASQIVVHGDQRNYCTALITLDEDAIGEWARAHGLAGKPYADIVTSPQVAALVKKHVDELNRRLNRWETIKRFDILERDLSVEAGEVTPSLKVKRKTVEEHYRDRLDALYG